MLSLLLAAVPAWAGLTNQDYTMDVWSIEEGLPQSSVNSIAQTPDGYLWLATYSGLARFDGVRFTQFDIGNVPGLPDNRLERLSVDREGGLWVIGEHNEVGRIKDGTCRAFAAAEGVPDTGALWVGEDGQGGRWLAGTQAGLWRWEQNRFVPAPSPPTFAGASLRTMVTDTAGRPWFLHRNTLYGWQNGRLNALPGPDGQAKTRARRVCASRDGGLWIVTPEILRKYVQGAWLPQSWPCPEFKSSIMDFREDMAGNLWIATFENGLFLFTPTKGWVRFGLESGLPTLSLSCLFCDPEGSVWVGTDGGGLLRFKARLWKMVTRSEGLGVEAVQSLTQDQEGRIWLAGGGKTPYGWQDGRVTAALAPPLTDALGSVWDLLAARDGAMWIGTYAGKVFRYCQGDLKAYTQMEGIRALFEDRQGRIWVGGFHGLSRIEHEQVTHYSRQDGLASERVWALAESASGGLYIGTDGGGLNLLRDGRWTCYTRQNGLPDDHIRSLYVDREDGLWLGTYGGGLSRFQAGRFFNFRVKGGLPARRIGSMLEDNSGRLWMATDLGVLCAKRRELSEFAAGRCQEINYTVFDRSDGLATTEIGGVQPASLKASDGCLWFAAGKGATFMDPKVLSANRRPPPVVIEEVRIDGERAAEFNPGINGRNPAHGQRETSATPVTVQPQQHELEIHYTGLSYRAPGKVRFRYRLDGLEEDWVEAGTKRVANYPHLPAGNYRFRVTACNDSGVWNETGASLALMVLPPWWKTWWFRAAVVAAALGLLYAGHVYRLRHLQRLQAAQTAFSQQLIASQEQERKRIAAELHDTIGQNLLIIKNRAVLGIEAATGSPAATEQLEEVSRTASQAIEEVREISYNLRPYQLDRLGLTKALQDLVSRVSAAATIPFHTGIDHVDKLLPPESEIHIYRIVQESLNNIVKHSMAATARVAIRHRSVNLRLTIEDDGCGFDYAALLADPKSHRGFGLSGLAERVRILNGWFRYNSLPGRGTRLTVEVPVLLNHETNTPKPPDR